MEEKDEDEEAEVGEGEETEGGEAEDEEAAAADGHAYNGYGDIKQFDETQGEWSAEKFKVQALDKVLEAGYGLVDLAL